MPQNTPEQARQWFYCDSVIHYNNLSQPIRPIYLVEGVTYRGEMDSVIAAWKAGGATPRFRRIQGIKIFSEAAGNSQNITLDIFHSDGTSANNKFIGQYETVVDIPLEADSIHLSTTDIGARDLDICVW